MLERYRETIKQPYYQRKIYRNKIFAKVMLLTFFSLYPAVILFRNAVAPEAYIIDWLAAMGAICAGIYCGERAAARKFDGEGVNPPS